MIGLELPANKESGDQMTLYTVNISDVSITSQVKAPVFPLNQLEWPSITGMCYSEGNVYVTYFPMNPSTFETLYTDTTFVAVYSYPDMQFKTLMKDTRTGPAGSCKTYTAIALAVRALRNISVMVWYLPRSAPSVRRHPPTVGEIRV